MAASGGQWLSFKHELGVILHSWWTYSTTIPLVFLCRGQQPFSPTVSLSAYNECLMLKSEWCILGWAWEVLLKEKWLARETPYLVRNSHGGGDGLLTQKNVRWKDLIGATASLNGMQRPPKTVTRLYGLTFKWSFDLASRASLLFKSFQNWPLHKGRGGDVLADESSVPPGHRGRVERKSAQVISLPPAPRTFHWGGEGGRGKGDESPEIPATRTAPDHTGPTLCLSLEAQSSKDFSSTCVKTVGLHNPVPALFTKAAVAGFN